MSFDKMFGWFCVFFLFVIFVSQGYKLDKLSDTVFEQEVQINSITQIINDYEERITTLENAHTPPEEITINIIALREVEETSDETEDVTEPELELLGEWRITAYCACEKCCGAWAHNRPGGIVQGASGEELIEGVSVAASLPFGTVIQIDGIGTYTVHDRVPRWIIDTYGETIDIYFSDHDSAWNFGMQRRNIYTVRDV